jgi:hypothetical protein
MSIDFNKTQKVSEEAMPHIKLFVISKDGGYIITDAKGHGFLTIQPTIEDVGKRINEVEAKGVEVRVFFHTLKA